MIRNGDGPGMIEYWRLDLIEFWQKGHWKYVVLGHNLLTGNIHYFHMMYSNTVYSCSILYVGSDTLHGLWFMLETGVNGFWGERVAADLVWNRTVNVRGGRGHNIAMDLENEFLNNAYKGS